MAMIGATSGHESIDCDFFVSELSNGDAFQTSSSSSFHHHGDRDLESSSPRRRKLREQRSSTVIYEEERSKETKRLRRFKLVIVILAVLLTAAVSTIVYFGISQAEQESNEKEYQDGAELIVLTLENNILDEIRSIESLAVYVSSYASGRETEWPFLEPIPNFETRAAIARGLSDGGMASSLSLILYVTDSNREQYEAFVLRHWMGADNNTELLNNTKIVGDVFTEIFELVQDPNRDDAIKKVASPMDSGPFFPVWMSDPSNLDAVNFNTASISPEWSISLNHVVGSNEPLITTVDTQATAVKGFLQRSAQEEPNSHILYPLTDGIGRSVGVLSNSFSWSSVLNNSLAIDDGEYIVEIDSACTQRLSFRVVGPEVEFLGPGLLHDPKYNSFQYTYDPSTSLRGRAKGPMLMGLLEKKCPYRVHVYATSSTDDVSTSNDAIYYTLGITLAFLIVTAVFCCFVIVIERRQKRVIRSADEARAIVSSLYPSQVRGRLMAHQRDNDAQASVKKLFKFRKWPKKTSKKHLKEKKLVQFSEDSFGDDSDLHGSSTEFGNGDTLKPRRRSRLKTYLDESTTFERLNDDTSSKPIADSFPSATILFADLVGFTSWCSLREPEKVFVLLEGIFVAFDKIAKDRKVFKIET
jgi:hypothetical protein